ncbi:DUF4395 domain-containing protein [Actinotalea sp.]|uniref:DUF4395 domain-containing protein n=1 Tax=Actinotalea sp. TaxID=1872145 RepID=UPI002CBE14A6|nr:DUF4395 domain-containing protein [Actinotalea sp.]HQY34687.1 DUF4395 domain-containing protein [Actinotalea sp.]HRA51952.1 DUF4395 domain-containing protein [Actinotalea sp.]
MTDTTTSSTPAHHPAGPPPAGIDPRGPRFGAGATAVLLAATVLLGATPAATALLAVVVALFAVGAARGAQGSLQGLAYRRLVRPRLAPPAELEDPRPPRFAQRVGLVITGTGLLLVLAGVPAAGPIAAAVALVAAFLNAAFGFCLGCELYLLLQRVRAPRR